MADLNVALILRLVDKATAPARAALRQVERAGSGMQRFGAAQIALSRAEIAAAQDRTRALGGEAMALAATSYGMVKMLQPAIDFEAAMAKVGAVSRANGDDLDRLTASARLLGRETPWSATQAAEGMQYLAMAGFSVNETIDAMPGMLTRAALDSLPEEFARIDALINNAGLALGAGPAQDCDLADWRVMIDTNVTGLVTVTRLLLGRLIASRGVVVNLASIAAHWPYPGGNVYGGTKAFVRQFSLGLRADLAGKGVRVTSIEPGLSESEFTLVRTGGDRAAYERLYAGAGPLQPEDIAATIHWVASLPGHVKINAIEIMPVSQSWGALAVHRDHIAPADREA